MKKLFSLLALAGLLGAATLAQENNTNAVAKPPGGEPNANAPIRLTSAEAKDHTNANAIVTGKVADVNKAAGLVRLNFDHPYPKQTLTAIVFARYTNLFPNLDQLKDKTVEVRGKIVLYRNRPEIQLQNTNQLRVVEAPADTEKK